MDTSPQDPTPTETIPEEPKKKFYRNPKVVLGVITAAVAAGAALVIRGKQKDDSDSPSEDPDVTVETFDET